MIFEIQTKMPSRWPYAACMWQFITLLLVTCAAPCVTFLTSDSCQSATWFFPKSNQEDRKEGLRSVTGKTQCFMWYYVKLSQGSRSVKVVRNWGGEMVHVLVWQERQANCSPWYSSSPQQCSLLLQGTWCPRRCEEITTNPTNPRMIIKVGSHGILNWTTSNTS